MSWCNIKLIHIESPSENSFDGKGAERQVLVIGVDKDLKPSSILWYSRKVRTIANSSFSVVV